ncbi:hypothetical protein EON65_25125 [archaeon]|nr:MAG: hypothetical protein EON65_25125 [archaeon]
MKVIIYFFAFVFLYAMECGRAFPVHANSSLDRAVIISTRYYHFEVAAVFAHHFKNMGLDSHVFVGQTVVDENYLGVGDWLRTYTPHLHRFSKGKHLNPTILEYAKSKVLVIVTSDESSDFLSLCLHHNLYNTLYAGAERVLLIMHNANSTEYLAQRCQDPKCYLIVLGENVYNTAQMILSQAGMTHVNLRWMSSIHPLAPQYIAPRDPSGPTRFILQGILTPGKRRDFNRLFACMIEIKRRHDIELVLIGKVATLGANLTIPLKLSNITTVVKWPDYLGFFRNVSSADYAILFSKFDFYEHGRITSSIPTSLVSNLPIILPNKLLSDYACLRNQYVHRATSMADDCSSVKAVLSLRHERQQQMRNEVAFCVKQLLIESRATLHDIVFGENGNEGLDSNNGTLVIPDPDKVPFSSRQYSHRFCK